MPNRLRMVMICVLCAGLGLWSGWLWRGRFGAQTVHERLYDNAERASLVIPMFHEWLYDNPHTTWANTFWLGTQIEKMPFDTWIYQEIIYETKPDVLIEAGTFRGGSAYYFASIFDMVKRGRVLTMDIVDYPDKPRHKRITYLLGSSTSDAIVQKIKSSIRPSERVMVSLDSDHSKGNVLKELAAYSGMVTVGNYLVVEDTDINGHPVFPSFGPGPMEAVQEFLKANPNFIQDRSREKYGVTFFPGGWLKRVR